MTTPRRRAIVSLATTMAVTLALGACAGGRPPRLAPDGGAATDAPPLAIRFDNEARERVHVYLIGERREWLLGRVEPGARATLRLPDAALAEDQTFVRLAVLAGGGVTLRAAQDVRAAVTIAQSASAVLSQRWTFSQGQLSPQQRRGTRAGVSPR